MVKFLYKMLHNKNFGQFQVSIKLHIFWVRWAEIFDAEVTNPAGVRVAADKSLGWFRPGHEIFSTPRCKVKTGLGLNFETFWIWIIKLSNFENLFRELDLQTTNS